MPIAALLVLAALLPCSCSHAPRAGGRLHAPPQRITARPEVDTNTLALWHLDEDRGDLALDAGDHGLDGRIGEGAAAAPGRFGGARQFDGFPEAFVLVPWKPALKDMRAFTVEAWIRPSITTSAAIQTLVAQWTSRIDHSSWYFGLTADNFLVFACVAQQPGSDDKLRIALSNQPVFTGAWTHVAVTYDEGVVQFYRDHELDDPFSDPADLERRQERLRQTDTQLTIGGFFDFYAFGGDGSFTGLTGKGRAFVGEIDEVRITAGVWPDLFAPGRH